MPKDQTAVAPSAAPIPKAPEAPAQVKARVLVQCEHGAPNEVAVVDAALLDSLAGIVDADPAAVEYAESLA